MRQNETRKNNKKHRSGYTKNMKNNKKALVKESIVMYNMLKIENAQRETLCIFLY